MWIVRLALRRPYTFVVVAMLLVVLGGWFIARTPKDIFPFINIPVVSVIWNYQGMPAEDFSQRITTYCEYTLSNNINDIERIESQTLDGVGIVRLFFHEGVEIEAAVAQATASCQSILRTMPPGMQPPTILRFNANTVPLVQMVVHSPTLTEQQLYDYALYRIRQFIATIQGTTLTTPYGGKQRAVMCDLDPVALQAMNLDPNTINNVMLAQNITTPTGDARIGVLDYRVNMNNSPDLIDTMNCFPVRVTEEGATIFLRDIGFAHDGFTPQTNIVRDGGLRAVLLSVLKNGAASTLDIISSVKDMLTGIRAAAPKGMEIDLLFDQSIFVKAAIEGVVVEGLMAALLTGSVVLLFLGSWKSTLIVWTSIPLSILASIICLSLIGHTLNLMTLGGLALAIGILVDDATVAIENISRNIAMGKSVRQGVLDGSYQVAVPAFVSTLCICIVFLPVTLLVGPAKFLFIPFAEAVVFAVLASYGLSRTLVPVMIEHLCANGSGGPPWLDRYHERFDQAYHNFRGLYGHALSWALHERGVVLAVFVALLVATACIVPAIGEDFFPAADAGELRLHVRAATGTRIEVTEEIFGAVEQEIKKVIPPDEIIQLIDNIGLPAITYNLAFGDLATIGSFDGEILIALGPNRTHSTATYQRRLREHLNKTMPDLTFYFQAADMVNQILNFGIPEPIDVRVAGYDKAGNLALARRLVERISHVPGAVDVHLHQTVDAPELYLNIDRERLAQVGLTQQDVANSVLVAYGTTSVVTPTFWLDRKMGIPYMINVQTPKYRTNDVEELLRLPLASPLTKQSQLLRDVCQLERRVSPDVVTHFNIQPAYDVYANVEGRDLGSVARGIQVIVDEESAKMPPGNTVWLAGQVTNMQQAFRRLGMGFCFAILLVYALMVVNFQSWLDPFIIVMALPGAVCGIIWMLYLTHTTFNVPSLMGAVMSLGVATANSILLVVFANTQLREGLGSAEAVHAAACTRLRPVLMTAAAMVVGMVPMALGLGEGGEQNAPLGRAVIGGLVVATFATLFLVPVIFSYLRKTPNKYLEAEPEAYTPTVHEKLEDTDV